MKKHIKRFHHERYYYEAELQKLRDEIQGKRKKPG